MSVAIHPSVRFLLRFALVAMLLALVLPVPLHAGGVRVVDSAGGRITTPKIIPPGSAAYGKTYGEWSATWWQWAFSIPLATNPLNDQTGANVAQSQSGNVWFLGGTFCPDLGSCNLATATRTCTVPAGKAFFFPIVNAECSTYEGNGTTDAELRGCARDAVDTVVGLACELDGVPIPDLAPFRAESPLFTWGPVPADNFIGAPAGTSSIAVSDGYFVMISPLSVGSHTLHFTGAFGAFFALDVTYHLNVKGGGPVDVTSMHDAAADPSQVRGSWGRLKVLYR